MVASGCWVSSFQLTVVSCRTQQTLTKSLKRMMGRGLIKKVSSKTFVVNPVVSLRTAQRQ